MPWNIPSEMSAEEQRIAGRLHRVGKFYVFLREMLPVLFDDEFQAELEAVYKPRGQAPLPAALLATVTLLQAYDQVSDANAVTTAEMDRRWQLVLGNMGTEKAPFSQGALVDFRNRIVEFNLDQKLLDRTVTVAKQSGKFGWQHLKAALDSSPLLGAGRVEDTWNLLGRAIRQLVGAAAVALKLTPEEIESEVKLTVLGGSSLKATLDIDWDDPDQRADALRKLASEAESLSQWVREKAGERAEKPPLKDALSDLSQVMTQDLEPDPNGSGIQVKRGVAKDRRPSLGDKEMRHGRKSRSKKFVGYKRHIAMAIGPRLILGAIVFPANRVEYEAAEPLLEDVKRHGKIEELGIDRGYLASPKVEELHKKGIDIRCKPWPSRNGGRFTKEDFDIRLEENRVVCPAGVSAEIRPESMTVNFPADKCGPCPLQAQCKKSTGDSGRSLTLHAQEELLLELRLERKTSEGRRELRKRVEVEHRLARIDQIQGRRARYKGTRKNTLDLRRCAVVANLQEIARRSLSEDIAV